MAGCGAGGSAPAPGGSVVGIGGAIGCGGKAVVVVLDEEVVDEEATVVIDRVTWSGISSGGR